MKYEIYKLHDIVYHWRYGKGKVVEINYTNSFPVKVQFENKFATFTQDGKEYNDENLPSLSFHYYNLIEGGFSQKRPLPNLKKGDVVYVYIWDTWFVRIFSHFDDYGKLYYYASGKVSDNSNVDFATKWSLNNPEEYNK